MLNAKRKEALEIQKLRKITTRLYHSCSTLYRDQNPSGGKFMCSYCGYVSKKPVLDIPGVDNGVDLDGKGLRNDCSGISCIFGNDGNYNRGYFVVRENFRGKSNVESSSLDDLCFTIGYCVSARKDSNSVFLKV